MKTSPSFYNAYQSIPNSNEILESKFHLLFSNYEKTISNLGIQVKTSHYIHIIRAFALKCSPPNSTAELIYHLRGYLFIYMLLNDLKVLNKSPSLIELTIDLVNEKPDSKMPSDKESERINNFITIYLQRLNNYLGEDLKKQFNSNFLNTLKLFQWELLQTNGTTSYSKLFNKRLSIIGNLPYLDICKKIFEIKYNKKNLNRLNYLDKLATQIIFLSNDLFSINRDINQNKLNLIIITAREKKISLQEAINEQVNKHNNLLYDILIEVEKELSGDLSDYCQFLKQNILGNFLAMVELSERYEKI